MGDLAGLLRDPRFQGLEDDARSAVLEKADPRFAELPPEGRSAILAGLRAKPAPAAPAPALEAPAAQLSGPEPPGLFSRAMTAGLNALDTPPGPKPPGLASRAYGAGLDAIGNATDWANSPEQNQPMTIGPIVKALPPNRTLAPAPPPPLEYPADRAAQVLEANRGKNFIDRLYDPNAPQVSNPDGSRSSHLMSSGEANGKGYAFPTLVQQQSGGPLTKLPPREAFAYAMRTGEAIEFDDPREAEAFAANGYKRGIPMQLPPAPPPLTDSPEGPAFEDYQRRTEPNMTPGRTEKSTLSNLGSGALSGLGSIENTAANVLEAAGASETGAAMRERGQNLQREAWKKGDDSLGGAIAQGFGEAGAGVLAVGAGVSVAMGLGLPAWAGFAGLGYLSEMDKGFYKAAVSAIEMGLMGKAMSYLNRLPAIVRVPAFGALFGVPTAIQTGGDVKATTAATAVGATFGLAGGKLTGRRAPKIDDADVRFREAKWVGTNVQPKLEAGPIAETPAPRATPIEPRPAAPLPPPPPRNAAVQAAVVDARRLATATPWFNESLAIGKAAAARGVSAEDVKAAFYGTSPERQAAPEPAGGLLKPEPVAPIVPGEFPPALERFRPVIEEKLAQLKAEGKATPGGSTPEEVGQRLYRALAEQDSRQSTALIDTPERTLHQATIADFLMRHGGEAKDKKGNPAPLFTPARERWADVVLGLPASGKSSAVVNPARKEHRALLADSDEAKILADGFDNGAGASAVHQESSDIIDDLLLPRAMRRGDNLAIAMVGKNTVKIEELLRRLKLHGYTTKLHYVDLPAEKAMQRTVTRYVETGRAVDPAYIEKLGNQPRETFDKLRDRDDLVDADSEVSTDVNFGEKPRLISERKLGQSVAEARVARGADPEAARSDRPGRGREGAHDPIQADAGVPEGDGERGRVRGVTAPVGDPALFDPVEFPTLEVPLEKISLSSEVENFKEGADPITGVVPGEQLQGKYIRFGTGPIALWERKDGRLEVISGRHRLDLARRTGEKTIPSQIVREADGFTADDARAFDAEANIRSGHGTTADYARYFRLVMKEGGSEVERSGAEERGLLSRANGKAGWAIGTKASADVYSLFIDEKINQAQAVAIALGAPGNAELQRVGSRAALNGSPADFIKNLLKAVDAETGGDAGTLDLFGNNDAAIRSAEAQARVAMTRQREIRQKLTSVRGAVNRPELAKGLGVDVRDPKKTAAKIQALEADLEKWDRWPLYPELVAQTKGEAPLLEAKPAPAAKPSTDTASTRGGPRTPSLALPDYGAPIQWTGGRIPGRVRDLTSPNRDRPLVVSFLPRDSDLPERKLTIVERPSDDLEQAAKGGGPTVWGVLHEGREIHVENSGLAARKWARGYIQQADTTPKGKPKTSAPEPRAEGAHPWQLTLEKWLAREGEAFGDKPKQATPRAIEWHKTLVRSAISRGDDVPTEVLEAYPDLAAKAPAPAPQLGLGFESDLASATMRAPGPGGNAVPPGLRPPKIDPATGLPLNPDGSVTVYHGTTAEGARAIRASGKLTAENEPQIHLTTDPAGGGLGDGTVVKVRVPPDWLALDDEFPDGRMDFTVETGRRGMTVPVTLEPEAAAPKERAPWEKTKAEILGRGASRIDEAGSAWNEEQFFLDRISPGQVSKPFHTSPVIHKQYWKDGPRDVVQEFAGAKDLERSGRVLLMERSKDAHTGELLLDWSPVGEYHNGNLGIALAYRGKGAGTAFEKWLIEKGHRKGGSIGYSPQGLKTVVKAHRQIVSDALAAGKPVPDEVLADYPDLAAEHTERGLVVRAGEAGTDAVALLTRPGHAYRGMTAEEFNATVGQGRGIQSSQKWSLPNEGTSFAEDAPTAESYANFGRTDPRKTGEPTYLIEVERGEGLKPGKDGYLKGANPITQSDVRRVWKMEADPQGNVVARQVPIPEKQPWEMTRAEFSSGKDLDAAYKAQYVGKEGETLASSQDVPSTVEQPPLGSWRIFDDASWNKYGDTIEQLRDIPVDAVRGAEDAWDGRGQDVKRYAQWIAEGKKAPPIRAAAMPDGTFRIHDGHRRVAAAKLAGKQTVRAWVAPEGDTGLRTQDGELIPTDMTHQMAIKRALSEGKPIPPEVLADYPDLQPPAQDADIWVNGDRAALNGDPAPEGFEAFTYLEGTKKGTSGVRRSPAARAADIAAGQATWQEQQDGYRRLRENAAAEGLHLEADKAGTDDAGGAGAYVSRVPIRGQIESVEIPASYWDDSWGRPDGYLYHVTSKPVAETILQTGEIKQGSRNAGRGGNLESATGKIFLTERQGVQFWAQRVEEHLFDRFDNPPPVAVVRFPKPMGFESALAKATERAPGPGGAALKLVPTPAIPDPAALARGMVTAPPERLDAFEQGRGEHVGGGSGAGPEEPDLAGNIRLDLLQTSEGVKQALRDVAAAYDDFMPERRGVVDWTQSEKLANEIGMTVDDLLQRRKGSALSAHEILAARGLLLHTGGELAAARDAHRAAPTIATRARLAFALARHAGVQEQVAGATAEAGRALNIFAKLGKEMNEGKRIKLAIKLAGGADRIDAIADILDSMPTEATRSKVVRKVVDITNWDRFLEYWKASLLSGLQSTGANSLSNELFQIVDLGAEALAGGAARLRPGYKPGEAPKLVAKLEATLKGRVKAIRALKKGIAPEKTDELAALDARIEALRADFDRESSRILEKSVPGQTAARARSMLSSHADALRAARHMVGSIEGARDALRFAWELFNTEKHGALAQDPGKMPEMSHATGAIGGKKGTWIRTPFRWLNIQDQVFKTMASRAEIASLAVQKAWHEGLTGPAAQARIEELKANPTEEMLEKAAEKAKFVTFQTKLGPKGMAVMRVTKQLGPLAQMIAPFQQTPGNILKRAVEYTPAAPALREFRDDVRAGGRRAELAYARLALGAAIGAIVIYYAAKDRITGYGPREPARRKAWLENHQPYSIKIGDTWHSYARLEPVASIIGISADMGELYRDHDDLTYNQQAQAVMLSIASNLISKTFMRSISDLISALDDPKRAGASFVSNMIGTAVPTGIAQVAREVDPVMRETTNPLEVLQSRVPGLSSSLPAKRSAITGEPVMRGGSLGPDLVSPIYTKTDKGDPVVAEMVRLKIGISQPDRSLDKEALTPQQYERFVGDSGRVAHAALTSIMEKPGWWQVPDDERVKMIRGVYEASHKQARDELRFHRAGGK